MLPLFAFAARADFVCGWSPDLGRGAWEPQIRASHGGMIFGSRGEGLGGDYFGAGFRMALQMGFVGMPDGSRPLGVSYGVIAGAQAALMSGIEPCHDGDDCKDVLLGPSLRFKVGKHP